MQLSEVLRSVTPVRGMTSVLAALIGGGDLASVSGNPATLATPREQAEAELAKYEKAMHDCQSDAAYWGYLGSVEYWRMVINLLKAAELVGADSLPDVPLPSQGGMVMDLLSEQAKFGKKVLRLAQESAKSTDAVDPVAASTGTPPTRDESL